VLCPLQEPRERTKWEKSGEPTKASTWERIVDSATACAAT
jgi:hypothetical protein